MVLHGFGEILIVVRIVFVALSGWEGLELPDCVLHKCFDAPSHIQYVP